MDGARLQSIVHRGYGIAAKNIGLPTSHHRPSSATEPVSPSTLIGTIKASFPPYGKDFQYGMPPKHGDPLRNGLFDATSVRVGDYLVSSEGTHFVAAIDHVQPPLCVRCDRALTFVRPQGAEAIGLGSYGGNTDATEDPYMVGWPASLNLGGGGKGGKAGDLPADGAGSMWEILVPAWGGLEIRTSDMIEDDLGRRYTIGGSERSAFGWRIRAALAVT